MTDPRVTERKFVRYREYMGEECSLNCYAVADDGTAWTSFWRGKEMQPWQQVLALPPADDPPPRDHRDAPGVSEPAETSVGAQVGNALVSETGYSHLMNETFAPSPTSPGPDSANAETVAREGDRRECWHVELHSGAREWYETEIIARQVATARGGTVVRFVPASRLADAERERDEARASVTHVSNQRDDLRDKVNFWKGQCDLREKRTRAVEADNETLRADLARERDVREEAIRAAVRLTNDLACVTQERDDANALALAWKDAAQRAGEELADTGPAHYYTMTAAQWLAWMRDKGLAVRDRLRCLTADFEDLAKSHNDLAVRHNALRERVEAGKRCWMENGQWFWSREPTAAKRSRFGPFTPGRFVKDEET